jgi:hypothetical protein
MEGIHREVRADWRGQHVLTSALLQPGGRRARPTAFSRFGYQSCGRHPAFVSPLIDGRWCGHCLGARTGRLDLASVPQLVRTLRHTQLNARLVVLDLRELQLMDSSGVHVIVNASIRARRLGGRLVLLRVGPTPTASSA